MNIIAIDIGNTNIDIGLFLNDQQEQFESIPGGAAAKLGKILKKLWQQCPVVETSKEGKREGVVVVSSVKPAWTRMIRQIDKEELQERIYVMGKDIPVQLSTWVDEPDGVGTDRLISAAAAYAVVENATAIIDVGTAVTIDLVDQNGVFQGGAIFPGFDLASSALKEHTAQLPKIKVSKPTEPLGRNTHDAINCGLYYSLIGAMEEILRRFAEKIGTWPQTVITGSGAKLIMDDCQFIDSYVPHLVVTGIVLAYKKYLAAQRDTT